MARRSSSSRPAPSRAPARAAPPPAPVPAQAAQPRQPGLLAQAASTGMGVAAGSVIGHGISSMIFGGGSRSEAPQSVAPPAATQAPLSAPACENDQKMLLRCLEQNSSSSACQVYLDMLQQCRQQSVAEAKWQ